MSISIHAPTRGATQIYALEGEYKNISIHAPTRGATFFQVQMKFLFLFQSTLPQGERLFLPHLHSPLNHISIHAPTRGATILGTRSYVGKHNFNPRSHKGSDENWLEDMLREYISIHAPTRGATEMQIQSAEIIGISIHAPTRGATYCSK